jgi:site-specific DNA-methyltransferase (adenine-specific)
MKPYYDDGQVQIFHADCRDVLPGLAPVDVVITDPVWPNADASLAGSDDPFGLFAAAAAHLPRIAQRAVVQMGCDSDPRMLDGIPDEMPFLRACWLEYVRPHYKGRILYTNDVAYVFGSAPAWKRGAGVIPGRFIQTDAAKRPPGHPCPRQYQHVRWLVRWFADGPVLDPFAGTGTTLRAAKDLGYPAIGIEIDERYVEIAVRRLEQAVLPGLGTA